MRGLDFHHLDCKDQRGSSRNDGWETAFTYRGTDEFGVQSQTIRRTVSEIGRNDQFTLLANNHALDALIPSLDDLMTTEGEPKWTAALDGRVKLSSIPECSNLFVRRKRWSRRRDMSSGVCRRIPHPRLDRWVTGRRNRARIDSQNSSDRFPC